MRLSASEKAEIIRIVKRSDLGVNQTLKRLGIHKRTFYNWYHRWAEYGEHGLEPKRRTRRQWTRRLKHEQRLLAGYAMQRGGKQS